MMELQLDPAGDGPFAAVTDGLVKRFGRVAALDGVDLRVPDGAVYVLVGANGAGKSTLLGVLQHVVRADAGRVTVLGTDVRRSGAAARARIGYVPEGHDLGPAWLRVGRLLRHRAAFYPSWDHAYAARLAEALDVRPDRRCGALSKGERRRVQLLLALAHRPALLLLDEPEDGLDHLARDRALRLLTEHLADVPTTVLLSTHRAHDFERLVDHVGVLHEGRLVTQTTREHLRRTLRRYRADVPDGWSAPRELGDLVLRRAALGRQIDWTVAGEEERVRHHLADSGAVVREIAPLSLDEAAVALLSPRAAS